MSGTEKISMKHLLFLLLALTLLAPRVHADDANDLVEDAEFVIKALLEDSNQGVFRSMLSEAHGVLIGVAFRLADHSAIGINFK